MSRLYAGAILAIVLTPTVWAQDSVRLTSGVTLRGLLERWDDRGVHLRLDNGKLMEYAPDAVAQVVASLSADHLRADAAMANKQWANAIPSYQAALATETRPWAVTRIQLGLLQALDNTGKMVEAAELFFAVAQSRTDVDVMAYAPLLWSMDPAHVDAGLRQTARTWVDGRRNEPLTVLVACSWLLATPDGKTVEPLLDSLRTYPDTRISWFARMQYQRYDRAPSDADSIRALEELIRTMPPTIRSGPQFALGLTYLRANRPMDAALAYLWIPFVYSPDSDLARRALLAAAQASEAAKLTDEATKLYRELQEKYPKSAEAQQAADRLNRLGQS